MYGLSRDGAESTCWRQTQSILRGIVLGLSTKPGGYGDARLARFPCPLPCAMTLHMDVWCFDMASDLSAGFSDVSIDH